MQLGQVLTLALVSVLLQLLLRLPQQLRSELWMMLGIMASTSTSTGCCSSTATTNCFALIAESLGCSEGIRAGRWAEFCVSVMAVAA
jgi:hypothetical protein